MPPSEPASHAVQDAPAKPRRQRGCCAECLLAALPFLAVFGGCLYREDVVADRAIRRIPIGATSAEVLRTLGPADFHLTPDETREGAPDTGYPLDHAVTGEVWLYRGSRWGSWAVFTFLCVYLDREGKVEHVSVTSTA